MIVGLQAYNKSLLQLPRLVVVVGRPYRENPKISAVPGTKLDADRVKIPKLSAVLETVRD